MLHCGGQQQDVHIVPSCLFPSLCRFEGLPCLARRFCWLGQARRTRLTVDAVLLLIGTKRSLRRTRTAREYLQACWCRSPSRKGEFSVFLRIDRLQIALPLPAEPAPNAAAAMQELLGGKYGEMSTLGNYVFQSFNLRSKSAQHCSCSIACSNAGRGWRCFGRRSRGPDAPAPLIASDYGGTLERLLLVTGPGRRASGPSHGYCRMGCSWSLPPALASFRRDGTEPTGGPSVFYTRVFFTVVGTSHTGENGTEAN